MDKTLPDLPAIARLPSPVQPTEKLLAKLMNLSSDVGELFLSPMQPPAVYRNGRLIPVPSPELPVLAPEHTMRIALDLIGERPAVLARLKEEGSCAFSYFLPDSCRFRVLVFSQRGSYAASLRIIPEAIPTFERLHLPEQLKQVVRSTEGLVLVTGPSGSGKSATTAALLNQIHTDLAPMIVTIEDPIEMLFPHSKPPVLQRELYRDIPSFAAGVRASRRLPPHVIFLSDLPDRETADLALDAADSGYLVACTLQTPDARRSVERLLRFFQPEEESAVRARLARTLRAVVSQRTLHPDEGAPAVRLFEILFSTPRVCQCIAKGETGVLSLEEAIKEGEGYGMQTFEMAMKKADRVPDRTGGPLTRMSLVEGFGESRCVKLHPGVRPRHMGPRLATRIKF